MNNILNEIYGNVAGVPPNKLSLLRKDPAFVQWERRHRAAFANAKAVANAARVAARLAESRRERENSAKKKANFNEKKERANILFKKMVARGYTNREVITRLAKKFLGVNIPTNGPLSRAHRASIHPNRGKNHKALRTVLSSRL